MQPNSLTISPIEKPDDHPERVRDDARMLLSSVRATIADLLRDVRGGDASALKELGIKQSELETALKRAFEAEARHHDWLAKQPGAEAAPGEMDLDAVRRDIACRLARLRECCQED
jgi:hypothetical protein